MNKAEERQLLLAVWQGFGLMVAAGIVIIMIFRWGEAWPFLIEMFSSDRLFFDISIGLASGFVMAITVFIVMKSTKLELPDNDMTRVLDKIIMMRWGIFTISVGAGIAEEFLFRGVIVGLAVNAFPVWPVLIINALLFALLHVPQYRSKPLMHVIIFIMGVWLGWLYILTDALIASIIAHAIYNAALGLHLRVTEGQSDENEQDTSNENES